MKPSNELHVVTEVGTFGTLNIDDPTKKKVAKENANMEALIREANERNLRNA